MKRWPNRPAIPVRSTDMYINVYHVRMEYGGPEEGGWWYDTGRPVESRRVAPSDNIEVVLAQTREKYEAENKGLPPKWSVNSTGVYEVRQERQPAKPFPEDTPHYE